MSKQVQNPEIYTIWNVLQILLRRWIVILLGLLTGAIIVLGLNAGSTLYFEAETQFLLRPLSSPEIFINRDRSEIKVLISRRMVQAVVKKLDLRHHDLSPKSNFLHHWDEYLNPSRKRSVVDRLISLTRVNKGPAKNFVSLIVAAPNPELAIQIVETWRLLYHDVLGKREVGLLKLNSALEIGNAIKIKSQIQSSQIDLSNQDNISFALSQFNFDRGKKSILDDDLAESRINRFLENEMEFVQKFRDKENSIIIEVEKINTVSHPEIEKTSEIHLSNLIEEQMDLQNKLLRYQKRLPESRGEQKKIGLLLKDIRKLVEELKETHRTRKESGEIFFRLQNKEISKFNRALENQLDQFIESQRAFNDRSFEFQNLIRQDFPSSKRLVFATIKDQIGTTQNYDSERLIMPSHLILKEQKLSLFVRIVSGSMAGALLFLLISMFRTVGQLEPSDKRALSISELKI